ncbi:hypothetical protein Tco_0824345 [Tanacetum coccineum]|uniref:Uncharacterized protein n=1 Tax=Tanacetum coccineum TaxID=301880 RepID=A0ABQ5ALI5_9ASTR
MRTKPGVDSLSFDDLYNNLRVFENNVKGSTASSSSTQNVAFVFENTSSTNDLDEFDLEEMDLKWQVAMISMRMKKFFKKTGRKLQFDAKEPVGFDLVVTNMEECLTVPPPMTGNYMPSGPDVEIDYSQFTYDCSVETNEPLLEPTVNKPKVVCQPKVWSDAPIIEEYESDSEDEHVS